MQIYKKKYIDVLELKKKDGGTQIVKLFFSDPDKGMRSYTVDHSRCLGYRQSFTGSGKCYEVMIGNFRRYIYLEKDRYFVDAITEIPSSWGSLEEDDEAGMDGIQ